MTKRYVVRLTDREREELRRLVSKGRGAAYKIRHANILLLADADGPGWTDARIAAAEGQPHARAEDHVIRAFWPAAYGLCGAGHRS